MNNADGPILLDSTSLASGAVYKVSKFALSPQYWHKVIVENADTESRDVVLTTLMEAVRPHDFIPVNYKVEEDRSVSFLMKNCGQAIMQLCWLHLTIPHPDENKRHHPFKIKIILCDKLASQLTLFLKPNIVKILKRRYDRSKKRLNLDQFHQDPELTQFFHLSQPKLLYFVLHLGRDLQIEHLKISNNDIESLNPFEAMCNEKCLKGLSSVDLGHNKIKAIEEINYLKMFPIRQLILDGNPICNDFTCQEYMKAVLMHIPNLSSLDDCNINKLGLLPYRRNFMCSQSGHELVDRFLEHYFNLYDSPDRSLLEGMYHRQAMFSLTQQFLADQYSSKTTKIMAYKKYARNIKSLTDFSKSDFMMFVGNQMISKIFSALPPTEHDPYTFTVDLMKFEGCMLVVTITGVYKHLGTSVRGQEEMYNFMRTFILIRINDEEYKIINDMMNVTNATSANESLAFRTKREPITTYINVPLAKKNHEMAEMLDAFVLLTNLKREWAKKCLKECEFDLKKSLNLFISLYKEDKLPQHAFNPEEPKPSGLTFPTEARFNPAPSVRHIPSVQSPPTNAHAPIAKPTISNDVNVCQERPANGSDKDRNEKDPPSKEGAETKSIDKITDDLVKKAVSIPARCPLRETRKILMDAAKSVLCNYKDLWYYGIVGIQFYKRRLFEEGRNFLTLSKSVLNTEKYEQLNLDFLLFEIEYGDSKYVDEALKKKILAESVDPVLEFVLNRVPTISRQITRTLLWRMAHYSLPSSDLKKIVNANKKFELIYGSTEDLEKIIRLEEEYFGSKSETKSRTEGTQRRSPPEPPRITSSDSPPEPPRITNSDSPTEVVEINTDENSDDAVEIVAETLAMTFEEFCMEIVKPIGVYVEQFEDPDIKKIKEFTGTNTVLINMCEEVLQKDKKCFSMVNVIFKKYWERNMIPNIRDLLAKAKDFPEKGLVNNLIVLFKIRMQLQRRKQSDTLQKIHLHLNKIPLKDVINFFEALSKETGNDINEIFESCLANENINENLKRIIILKYKAICKNGGEFEKYRKKKIFEFYTNSFNHMLFNYDEILSSIMELEPPAFISKGDRGQLRRCGITYVTSTGYSVEKCARAVLCIKEKSGSESQSVLDFCYNALDAEAYLYPNRGFQLCVVMTILATPTSRKCTVKRLDKFKPKYDLNANYVCTVAEICIIRMNVDQAVSVLLNYIKDPIILDTDVQRCLYQYFQSWKRKYNLDMLNLLSQKGDDGNKQTESSNEDGLLLSSDNEDDS